MMKFYRGETEDGFTYRIVKDLGNNWFVVVKLVTQGVYTLKIWKGDLNMTAKFWKTKPFTPDPIEQRRLIRAFKDVVNKMRPKFSQI